MMSITSVGSGDGVVSVSEGGNVDISCTSTGVPVPTITWTFDNQETNFSKTNISQCSGGSRSSSTGPTLQHVEVIGQPVWTYHVYMSL